MWREVSFEDDSGAKVTLEVRDERLSRAIVTLHGRRVVLPEVSLADVLLPVLSEANLVYSSSVFVDRVETSVALEIPVLDPKLEVQDPHSLRRYQFIFRDYQLVERVLEERRGNVWQTVDRKDFSK